MITDWPGLNTLIWLRLPCCEAEHPTRVEDFAGDDCVIGEPISPHRYPVDPEIARDGFFLGWVSSGGALEVPVTLVEADRTGVPTWKVKAVGPAVPTQRRNYVRLEMKMTVQLYLLEGGAATEALLLDVSEGGMRCRVDKFAMDPGEKAFSTQISLETRDFFLRSQVAWRGRILNNGDRELGLRFLDIEPTVSDAIRSYIFAEQLAQRRRQMQ